MQSKEQGKMMRSLTSKEMPKNWDTWTCDRVSLANYLCEQEQSSEEGHRKCHPEASMLVDDEADEINDSVPEPPLEDELTVFKKCDKC